MDYEDVFAALSVTPPVSDVELVGLESAGPARRLRDAIEPLATHPIWSRQTNGALAEEGLDFLGSYIAGRAGALGDPAASVVAAAFAVFEPGLVGATYRAAIAACPLDRLLDIRERSTTESLTATLESVPVEEVVEAVAALQAAVASAPSAGRPLFAGLLHRPKAVDPFGGLWRVCEALREHRGDTHIAACLAEGLDAVQMNVLTELWLRMEQGTYSASRGWSPEQIEGAATGLRQRGLVADGALTAAGRELRQRIEDRTDHGQRVVVDALGDRFESLVATLAGWSEVCVESLAFPADPFKRAAG